MIPYSRQCIENDDIQAVVDVLKSDYLTTGPKVEEFEQLVAKYVGANYAVAFMNGTVALHAACVAAGVKSGDEVITSPITFAASAKCVLYCGGTPVFADIDDRTYNIDPEDIKRKITPHTRAIIPVHLAGQPCDMDPIHEIAKEYHLTVIEDGAHALGAKYKTKKIGCLSDMTMFSFHPVKSITTGEGGMITTNNKEMYEKLKLFRTHGITREVSLLKKDEGSWYYEQQQLGYNYRITDIQCARGISQMGKLERFVSRRKELALKYDGAFKDEADIVIPHQLKGADSAWHLYIIQVPHHDRKEVFERLRVEGVGVNVHYIPVYQHPYYQDHGYSNVYCKNSENLYKHIISLPLHPLLTDDEQDYIIKIVKKIICGDGA